MSICNGTKKLINTGFISNISEYNAKYDKKILHTLSSRISLMKYFKKIRTKVKFSEPASTFINLNIFFIPLYSFRPN